MLAFFSGYDDDSTDDLFASYLTQRQLGKRLYTILLDGTRSAKDVTLQVLQNIACGPQCASILLSEHQDLLQEAIKMLTAGRLLPQTRQEVIMVFANLASTVTRNEDQHLYLGMLRKYLLPALVHEITERTPNRRLNGHVEAYQLTQVQFLFHIFKKWGHLPTEFANTYGLDCLGAFEYSTCTQVFVAYEEFVREFFEVHDGSDCDMFYPAAQHAQTNDI